MHPLLGIDENNLSAIEEVDTAFEEEAEWQEKDKTAKPEKKAKDSRKEWLKRLGEAADKGLILAFSRLGAFLDLFGLLRTKYPDKKIVVFSMFLQWLDIIEEALQRENQTSCYRFDGTTSDADRE
ncbi:hypothetical protein Q7P37_005333 [Cladosporium fusiforme]